MKTKHRKKNHATPPEVRRLPDRATKSQPCMGSIGVPSNTFAGTLAPCEESSGQGIFPSGGRRHVVAQQAVVG